MVLVAKVVRKNPVTAPPHSSLRELAELMKERNVGSVIIVNNTGRLLGIVTERDLVRAISEKVDLDSTLAEHYMSRDLVVAHPEDSLVSAAHKMIHHNIRHLPVVDDGEKLVGVISIRDVLSHILSENEFP